MTEICDSQNPDAEFDSVPSELEYLPYMTIENPNDFLMIPMGGLGFLDENNDKRYLITTGLATCIGIAAYNPTLKKIGLAHVSDTKAVGPIVMQLLYNVGSSDHVYVVGGRYTDPISGQPILDIKDQVKKQLELVFQKLHAMNARVKHADVWKSIGIPYKDIKSLILDKTNGTAYKVIPFDKNLRFIEQLEIPFPYLESFEDQQEYLPNSSDGIFAIRKTLLDLIKE